LALLTSEGRVAGNAVDESAKDGADTDTSASETDGGGTSTVDLGSSDDGGGRGLDDDAAGLHDATHHVGGEVIAGAIEEQAMADGGLLAYRADDGAGDGSCVEANCVNKKRVSRASTELTTRAAFFYVPCDVDIGRESCFMPMRATAPVILLVASILSMALMAWMDGECQKEKVQSMLGGKVKVRAVRRKNGRSGKGLGGLSSVCVRKVPLGGVITTVLISHLLNRPDPEP